MSYDKMMRWQHNSIAKQKRRSYKPNIISSLPSDKDVTYPEKVSDINHYDLSDFTEEQRYIICELFKTGYFKGMPYFEEDAERLRKNLFSHVIKVDGIEVVTVKTNFGFSFAY